MQFSHYVIQHVGMGLSLSRAVAAEKPQNIIKPPTQAEASRMKGAQLLPLKIHLKT